MLDRNKLRSDIALAEGCKLVAYKDSLGYWTIGYGRLMTQSGLNIGFTCTQEQADRWLAEDLATAEHLASTLLEWSSLDTDARQNALVELVFNMGTTKWQQFVRTRAALTKKNWRGAYVGLLDSLWARQVGPSRSNRIANYILSGEFT